MFPNSVERTAHDLIDLIIFNLSIGSVSMGGGTDNAIRMWKINGFFFYFYFRLKNIFINWKFSFISFFIRPKSMKLKIYKSFNKIVFHFDIRLFCLKVISRNDEQFLETFT